MRLALSRYGELWRYYQSAVVNTLFGFGLFALLIRAGLNLFVAQAVAFICGVAFNYVVYSNHAFRGAGPAKLRFALAYLVNYAVNLGLLAAFSLFVRSHYLAGAMATVVASLINFFVLKYVVFPRKAA